MTPVELEQIARAVENRVADAVEKRLEPRFDAMDRGFNQVLKLRQAMATGHNERFNSLERGQEDLRRRVGQLEKGQEALRRQAVGLQRERVR